MSLENEKLYTIKEAAGLLGFKYWQLQRAIKAGTVPGYRLHNTRKYVYLSEVRAALRANRCEVRL